MNYKQAAIKAGVGLLLFPFIGALLVLIIKGGDFAQTVAVITSNVSLQVIFLAAAGFISGAVVQQSKAGYVELAVAGLVASFIAVVIFGTAFRIDAYQPSYAASAFLGAPVAVMGTALVLIPRLVYNIVRR